MGVSISRHCANGFYRWLEIENRNKHQQLNNRRGTV